MSSFTLQQGGAEKSADEHNSAADQRSLAAARNLESAGSAGGRSRGATGAGGLAGSVGGNGSHAAGAGLSSGGRLATSVLATRAGETGSLAGTVLHVVVGTVGNGRKVSTVEVLDVPGVASGRAGAGLAVGLVAAVALRGGVVLELLHQSLEVVVLSVGASFDGAETVLGVLLGVLVDEATGVDGGHVRVVKRLDSAEGAGVLVAAVLGKASGCQ